MIPKTYKIETIWGNGFVEVNHDNIVIRSTNDVFIRFIGKRLEELRSWTLSIGGNIEKITGEA